MDSAEPSATARPRASSGASAQRLTIGRVIDELSAEFPDLAASKLRFLEDKGIVTPQRTSSGYRSFTAADVARIRSALTLQRDLFLPLARIREILEAADRGEAPEGLPAETLRRLHAAGPDGTAPVAPRRHGTTAELAQATGVSDAFVHELEQFGLLTPPAPEGYDVRAETVVSAAATLAEHGLAPRHMRAFRMAADRQIGLLDQVLVPLTARRDASVRARASETAHTLEAACAQIHGALLAEGMERWHD